MNTKLPLVVIAGPTASGKSGLALALSRLTPATIINADSMQVYRDLSVVTARPTPDEEAIAPHRLFGYIDGADACSAARWATEAAAAIAAAHQQGHPPILVGGTGLYIRALLDGIATVPMIDLAIRAEVRALPVAAAHDALVREDPIAAARLAPADTTRVARALEVKRSTGVPLAVWQKRMSGGIADAVRLVPIILLPPRDMLMAQCDARFEAIFENGQNEVKALTARRLDPNLPVMRAIGVREIAAFQNGVLDRSEALYAGKLATRQYAKRQYTWFRRQLPVSWFRYEQLLDSELRDQLAIKLRNMALTS